MKTFKDRVLEIVTNIPKGETLSYKEVAIRAGSLNGARAVGMIMSKNKDLNIPCHRVIRSDGKMGGYNGIRGGIKGVESKMSLLNEEKSVK